jgi:hypothetical protein
MKCLLFALLFSTLSARADVLNLTVSNFNFSYSDPKGRGTASAFTRSNYLGEAVSVDLEKQGEDFFLRVEGAENGEFSLKNAPGFMTEAQEMVVTDLNLSLAEQLSVSVASGHFISKDDELKLSGFSLNCSRDVTTSEPVDQLLIGCIQSLNLKSNKFSSSSVEQGLFSVIPNGDGVPFSDKGNLGISSLELKTTNGKYDLVADVKAQVSGRVKSYGSMTYDQSSGVLSIRIAEVKFGFLNVTSKVFDELKKSESDKLKVKPPFVYYKLR